MTNIKIIITTAIPPKINIHFQQLPKKLFKSNFPIFNLPFIMAKNPLPYFGFINFGL